MATKDAKERSLSQPQHFPWMPLSGCTLLSCQNHAHTDCTGITFGITEALRLLGKSRATSRSSTFPHRLTASSSVQPGCVSTRVHCSKPFVLYLVENQTPNPNDESSGLDQVVSEGWHVNLGKGRHVASDSKVERLLCMRSGMLQQHLDGPLLPCKLGEAAENLRPGRLGWRRTEKCPVCGPALGQGLGHSSAQESDGTSKFTRMLIESSCEVRMSLPITCQPEPSPQHCSRLPRCAARSLHGRPLRCRLPTPTCGQDSYIQYILAPQSIDEIHAEATQQEDMVELHRSLTPVSIQLNIHNLALRYSSQRFLV